MRVYGIPVLQLMLFLVYILHAYGSIMGERVTFLLCSFFDPHSISPTTKPNITDSHVFVIGQGASYRYLGEQYRTGHNAHIS